MSTISTDTQSKLDLVSNHLRNDFVGFLKTLMIGVGFDEREMGVYHPCFHQYLFLSTVQISARIQKLKEFRSEVLNDEEIAVVRRLSEFTKLLNMDVRMENAVSLFNLNFFHTLKKLMLHSNFTESESIEGHKYFTLLLSEALSFVSKLFLANENSIRTKERMEILQRKLDNASSIKLIRRTNKHEIYCVLSDSEKIALKLIKSHDVLQRDIESLNSEHNISSLISHPVLRPSLGIVLYCGKPALALHWIDGHPLNYFLATKRLDIKNFLFLARELASSLLALHKVRRVHLNLTCSNIIYDEKSKIVRMIGLGHCSEFRNHFEFASSTELLEKDLQYLAPEALLGFRREIDYRTDFFNLGIIFYKCLCGEYPMGDITSSPRKIMHSQIFQIPRSLQALVPDIPNPISEMIKKLMCKEKSERYRSAAGIIYDLDLIASELDSNLETKSFQLAEHDDPDVFQVSDKLYSRSSQFKMLNDSLERLSSKNNEIAFVVAKSGCGKSYLIDKFYKEVVKRHGIIASGKFDEHCQNPYSALLDALNNLCDSLFLEEKEIFDKYKTEIQEALGEEAKLLSDLLSNLHKIIGDQPNVPTLYGIFARNRFIYVVNRFLKAVSSVGVPVVFVLEDLHCLDNDSYLFLKSFLIDETIPNIMFIGTYRDDELSSNDMLASLFSLMLEKRINYTVIHLDYLNEQSVDNMVADTLLLPTHERLKDSYSLSSLLYRRSKGNPLYLKQLLLSLHDEGQIYFCNQKRHWRYLETNSNESDVNEDLREFLRNKVSSHDENAVFVLKVASCLGCPFSLQLLKILVHCDNKVEKAISTGLIIRNKGSNNTFRFVHDQIRYAVNSLIPEERLKSLLAYIGQKLYKNIDLIDLNQNIFLIATLLQYSIDSVQGEEHKVEMGIFYLNAGKKAMALTAFEEASHFLSYGRKLISSYSWKNSYEFCLKLYYTSIEAAYCMADLETLNLLTENLLKYHTSAIDMAEAYHFKIRLYSHMQMHDEATMIGKKFLPKISGLAVELNENEIDQMVLEVKNLLFARESDIVEKKEMKDQNVLLTMKLLYSLCLSCCISNLSLLSLVGAYMAKLTVQYGISKYSSLGLSCFGISLCRNGDYSGLYFGKMALIILDPSTAKEMLPSINLIYYSMMNIYSASLRSSLEPLKKTYTISFEVGNIEYGFMIATTYCMHAYFSGIELKRVLTELEVFETKFPTTYVTNLCVSQSIKNLSDESVEKPEYLSGDNINHVLFLQENKKPFLTSRCLIFCIVLAFIFNNYDYALNLVERVRKAESSLKLTYYYLAFLFYDGMVSMAVAEKGQKDDKQKQLQRAKECISILQNLPSEPHESITCMISLLQAELESVVLTNPTDCNIERIVKRYKETIELFNQNGFLQYAGIACERAGMFLQRLKKNSEACTFIQRAHENFCTWGAVRKTTQLKSKYPQYLRDIESVHINDLMLETSSEVSQITLPTIISSGSSQAKKRVRFN